MSETVTLVSVDDVDTIVRNTITATTTEVLLSIETVEMAPELRTLITREVEYAAHRVHEELLH